MAVQYTLADGFFNRKRGRPPKNRYVQVYKNLQFPPQAVFTSFKLERQNSSTLSSLSIENKENDGRKIISETRSELSSNMYNPLSTEIFECLTMNSGRKTLTDNVDMELQPKSVIRSTGIYYPDSVQKAKSLQISMINPKESLADPSESSKSTIGDLPEDLSLRSSNTVLLNSNIKFTYSYLQMLQLINTYYRTLPLQCGPEMALNSNMPLEVKDSMDFDFSRHHVSEDCGFRFCRYRNRQTHYHCTRSDCEYSFCEKSRFAQHVARHKRLDRLLGTDFKQYHPNAECEYSNCFSAKKPGKKPAPHFHCLNCSFSCWETHKFAPHRRWHRKLEVLQKTGFQKIRHSEHCNFGESISSEANLRKCSYSGKKTHYHCFVCGCSVLSKCQIFGHKHKSEVKVALPQQF